MSKFYAMCVATFLLMGCYKLDDAPIDENQKVLRESCYSNALENQLEFGPTEPLHLKACFDDELRLFYGGLEFFVQIHLGSEATVDRAYHLVRGRLEDDDQAKMRVARNGSDSYATGGLLYVEFDSDGKRHFKWCDINMTQNGTSPVSSGSVICN